MRNHNRLTNSCLIMRDVQKEHEENSLELGLEIPVVNMVFKRDRRSDQRRYNKPTENEVAMVFVNNDGEPPFERDIRIYPKNPIDSQQYFININILLPNLDPMTYHLLFPYGEPGWQPNWECESYPGYRRNRVRVKASMLEYKSALAAIRDNFSPVLHAGKLTQQWLVDSYLQIEANNLNYVKFQQKKLRAELYNGLADFINAGNEAGVQAGVPVILPSSFEGSPRNTRERCCDAMSIFARYGAPDLFITFTANPTWSEIVNNLRYGEVTSDRPDLVARVFNLKLTSLMEDLTKNGILGICIAYCYTIEFQKRGLPHAHILIVLQTDEKFNTIEKIDNVVWAEIFDKEKNPKSYDVVTKFMIHGPCGSINPKCICMENNRCKKHFPKEYNEKTKLNIKGYPVYRRRYGVSAQVRRNVLNNQWVIPYNPYLLLKYNAHLNVEVCTSILAVKYIYKYIYKGYDCTNLAINQKSQNHLV